MGLLHEQTLIMLEERVGYELQLDESLNSSVTQVS